MRDHLPLVRDVTTFLVIAFVAYPFGFLGATGTAELVGKVVCGISIVLALLCFAVKRPPSV